ncbi:hypothetical protein HELRODRAFT_186227 [Helobdella robusta]|uniref:Staphylococcal nuclease domain-containing protein 1 n=1 Tax=Helobdella robusta TaxID=6412 RepID=T1FNU4_HELRO|nr:hypothetical protein HELRODRAFT_186227 [Helobdella robusta]ESN89999.1 hypothetical protein HELRODRAFT_186227 [Helobdella robusta]
MSTTTQIVPSNPANPFGSGSVLRGTVKSILSGDTIIVRGVPKGGPPPERTVGFSGITAPKLARRPFDAAAVQAEAADKEIKDEPFAWEAREFLRKKLIGKEVCFVLDPKTVGNKKEYGVVYLGKDTSGENILEALVSEGLADVRKGGMRVDDNQTRLIQLEEAAQTSKKGKWGPTESLSEHVRDISWNLENPRQFVESNKGKEIDAVIEFVRDGCTVRAFLLPSFQYVTIMFTGIKTPMFKMEDGTSTAEPYAEEAKYFTEVRLLQRDVKVLLEGTSNQNLLATILHPSGNITELLLLEGFAHCSDWSMKSVTNGVDRLRSAEKSAKEKKLRIWKNFQSTSPAVEIKEKNFTGKVVEVVNGDALILKLQDGTFQKIFLSSIRSPRLQDVANGDGEAANKKIDAKNRPRPLYDIPYMFEAREFLRKKLIGKKINVEVDYIQPKSTEFPEKTCCTINYGGINIAEALVSKGLATVVKYRQNDDQRSSFYDDLLKAEDRAMKKGVGLHSKKEAPVIRVADISGDLQKAKHFLSFLQRAGKCEALVEFVASGSRFRLYIPKETCLITFLLSGIECPRGARPSAAGGPMMPADAFGEEAFNYVKEMIMQKEVLVEVESMDKGGNFIGWCFVDGVNLSVALVEEGLARVHFTAEKSNHYGALQQAEGRAKMKKLNLWSIEEEKKEEVQEVVAVERRISYQTIVITEISNELHFYAQNVETGPSLEKLMNQLRLDFNHSPPIPASYTPRKGELCAAKFSDGDWYRALIEKTIPPNKATVLYVDYGNHETVDILHLASLPSTYQALPHQAHLYALACITLPKDPEDVQAAVKFFSEEVAGRQFLLNVEYKNLGIDYVTLVDADDKELDIGQLLISEGLVVSEKRREKHLKELVDRYKAAEEKAKRDRVNLWNASPFDRSSSK